MGGDIFILTQINLSQRKINRAHVRGTTCPTDILLLLKEHMILNRLNLKHRTPE